MADKVEGPKPVEAKKPEVAKVETAKVDATKKPEVAEKPITPEQAKEAGYKKVKEDTQTKLSELKGRLAKPTEGVAANSQDVLFAKMKSAVSGKIDPFTKKNQNEFLTNLTLRLDASPVVKALPDADRENAKAIFMDRFFDSFQTEVMTKFPETLADIEGADELDLTVEVKDGKAIVALDPTDAAKLKDVQKKIEEKGKELVKAEADAKKAEGQADAGKVDVAMEGRKKFETDFPGIALFLQKAVFGGDESQMNDAFAGKGFWGLLLGIIGYGAGKEVYGKFALDPKFAPYVEKGKHELAKVGVETRTVVLLDKPEALKPLYDGIKEGTTRAANKPFEVKAKMKLPSRTKVEAVIFPEDFKIGDKEYKKDEVHKDVVLPAGTELPIGTKFRDAVMSAGDNSTAKTEVVAPKERGVTAEKVVEKRSPIEDCLQKIETSDAAQDTRVMMSEWLQAHAPDAASREMYAKNGKSMKIADLMKAVWSTYVSLNPGQREHEGKPAVQAKKAEMGELAWSLEGMFEIFGKEGGDPKIQKTLKRLEEIVKEFR